MHWALEVDGMDGRRAGSCPLQLLVRIGQVWRVSGIKGTAVGISLALTRVVEKNQRFGEVRQGPKSWGWE